jgi:hypothetical protein
MLSLVQLAWHVYSGGGYVCFLLFHQFLLLLIGMCFLQVELNIW